LQKYGDLKIVDNSGRLLPTKYDDGQQLKDQDSRAVGKVNSQVEMLPSSTEWTPNKSFITSEVEATDPTSIAAQLRATGREPKGKQLSTKYVSKRICMYIRTVTIRDHLIQGPPVCTDCSGF
jgi:hypothetical protein